jgi:hypothetical protein
MFESRTQNENLFRYLFAMEQVHGLLPRMIGQVESGCLVEFCVVNALLSTGAELFKVINSHIPDLCFSDCLTLRAEAGTRTFDCCVCDLAGANSIESSIQAGKHNRTQGAHAPQNARGSPARLLIHVILNGNRPCGALTRRVFSSAGRTGEFSLLFRC